MKLAINNWKVNQPVYDAGEVYKEYYNRRQLLDLYRNAAAAYSVRGVSYAYYLAGGKAMQVRRSSDDALLDIGFVWNELTQSLDLDTASLLSFVGAGNGFVKTWYDQSGNANNAQQTSTSSQPQIVSSGVILTKNSKPKISFNGTSNYFRFNTYTANNSQFHVVDDFIQTSNFTRLLFFTQSDLNTNFAKGTVTKISTGSNYLFTSINSETGSASTTTPFQQSHLLISMLPDAESTISPNTYQNSVLNEKTESAVSRPSAAGTYSYIGARKRGDDTGGADNYADFDYQEIVVYGSDESSNRTGIESNINSYFSIYSPPSGVGTWAIGTTFVIQ